MTPQKFANFAVISSPSKDGADRWLRPSSPSSSMVTLPIIVLLAEGWPHCMYCTLFTIFTGGHPSPNPGLSVSAKPPTDTIIDTMTVGYFADKFGSVLCSGGEIWIVSSFE